jgi:hypothetical protein
VYAVLVMESPSMTMVELARMVTVAGERRGVVDIR